MSNSKPPRDLDARTPSATEASFGEILSQYEESHRQAAEGRGESRKGTVVAVTSDGVVVDVGLKTEGMIPLEEFKDIDVKPGDLVVVSVRGRAPEGYYLLSKIKIERPKDWSGLEAAFAEKRTIAGVVSAVIKGGLSVDVGVRAFLPASRSGTRTPADLEQLVGQEIACKIIKLDVTQEDVVVDRRAVLEEEELRSRQARFDTLEEGQVVRGTVRSLTDFGAFVDLGGMDGLLHVADLAWSRVEKPADVLKLGDEVEVKILKINRDTHKISLGMKQLQPDPWTLVEEKYHTGDRVRGKVTRVAEFGAFTELEPGVEGLIHLSDLSWSKKARKPSDVVKPGDLVEVVVLTVSGADKRIGLGLKQALGDPWEEAIKKFPVGSTAEGKVVSLAKFGAFVELAEGIEGMIHVGDISAEKRINHPQDELKMGQVVKAMVLEADRERRRIRLGMKQLIPTSADEYIAEHKPGDLVTGRIVEVSKGVAQVELGEGLLAPCTLPNEPKKKDEPAAERAGNADVGALSALLAAKWKQGVAPATGHFREAARPGQIRTFRITALDAGAKKIALELAG